MRMLLAISLTIYLLWVIERYCKLGKLKWKAKSHLIKINVKETSLTLSLSFVLLMKSGLSKDMQCHE